MRSTECNRPRASNRLASAGRILLAGATVLFALISCTKPPVYQVVAAREGYTHVISQGETLDTIAEKYYGEARLGRAIGEYNKLDPLKPLEPGASLIVPFDATELETMTRVNEGNVAYNRGTMLARTGQYAEAVPYLEDAVATDPSNADALYNLAVTFQELGQYDKALAPLERLVNARPSDQAYQYTYGSVLRSLNRKRDALRAFQKAVKLSSDYREAHYALALTYEDLGKNKQAREGWQRYLELDSDSAWAEEARIHLDKLAETR
jgi:tetratricopeptide (TPR) repeat protein